MISVIIADDHQMFIDGIKSLLEHQENIAISGEAKNGEEVIELLEKQQADIILMDINMPELNGVDATKIIHKKFPNVKVLMLTMHNTKEYIAQMVAAGASGYILKNTGKEELIMAIEALYRGENYYSKEVTARIMESMKPKREQNFVGEVELTDREKEVLKLIVQELTTTEIAEKLFISHHTVETHRKNLISKLNVKNTAGLVKYAFQNGIVE